MVELYRMCGQPFAVPSHQRGVQASEEFQAVFHLLQQLWNRRYTNVWAMLVVDKWSPKCGLLVEAIAVTLRERVLELISKSYTTILVTNAAQLAGMSEADMAAGEASQHACCVR